MNKIPSLGIAAVGLACITASGFVEPYVAASRKWAGTDRKTASSPARNETPLVVFSTVALGGFKGILIDVLWARAAFLQESGDYIEIAQLSDWITKLEPRLPVVWDYHSFNMAYNISVMFTDPADRWRWISAGIEMLRDNALVYNPHEAMLYDRLCRIYLHKLVEPLDPAGPYYRMAMAKEMDGIVSPPATGTVLARTDNREALQKLADLKLDHTVMLGLERLYGPLDWRLPETHVLYWAARGAMETRGRDAMPFDILVCSGLSASCLRGRVVDFRPSEGILETGVRADLLDRTLAAFAETSGKYNMPLESEAGLGNVYRNFLRRAVLALKAEKKDDEAMRIFLILRDHLHDRGSDLPFQQYVESIRKSPRLADPEIERGIQEMRDSHLRR